MRSRSLIARAALALVLAAALPALAAPARRHLDTKGEPECATCHRADTPEAFAAWEGSPHGLALVKCVACHGSTGADFKAKPAATGCRSCHPAQAEALAKRAVRDCYACHDPHALTANPHR